MMSDQKLSLAYRIRQFTLKLSMENNTDISKAYRLLCFICGGVAGDMEV